MQPQDISTYSNTWGSMKCIALAIILLATTCAASAAGINPSDVSYNKSVEYFISGSYEQALGSINKSLEENPNDNAYWSLKVQILLRMGKFNSALSTLDEALQTNSSNAQAWNDRGLLEAGYLQDYDRAIQSFNRSIKIDPGNAKTYYNKGMTLENMGRYDDAFQSFEKAVSIQHNFSMAWFREGIVLAKMGKHNESLLSFQQAITLSPDFAEAWNQKGLSYSALKQYNDALTCFDKATQLDKTNRDAWTNKGNALKALNRESEAEIAYSMAGNKGA
jgi:tetratricopeptide (TPR) repeat protein